MAFETVGIELPPTPKRWSAREYMLAAEAGAIGERQTELIDGEILVLSPQSLPHVKAVARVGKALRRVFSEDSVVSQSTASLSEFDMPEPAVAVLSRSLDELEALPGPADIDLVVEVSLSSLEEDRAKKAALYSRAGIPEYWILNLRDRRLEIYRTPTDAGYAEVETPREGQVVSPLAALDATVAVNELLP